jgi:addiction module RelE/StbE family toxin
VTYRLVTTSRFDRRSRQFVRAHPDLKARLARVLRDLESDPFQANLHLHPLHGELEGLHAVRVTHSYRIVLTLQISPGRITLLDIGSHNEVYR